MKKIIYINDERDFKKLFENNDNIDFIDDDNDNFNDGDDELDESDSLNEAEGDDTTKPEEPMDEEKLRIESLKLATNIAKLMDNVTPDDIIKLAGMVGEFIRNNRNGDISSNENPFTDDTDTIDTDTFSDDTDASSDFEEDTEE